MLKNLALTLNPTLYNQRLQELSGEKSKLKSTLPVFFYATPMFPGQKLALHFFEPRYKV